MTVVIRVRRPPAQLGILITATRALNTAASFPPSSMSSAFLAPVSAAPGALIAGNLIPNDVLGVILHASPDFRTLYSAVGVCKTWHGVFQAQPKSVLLSVARNVVGPALTQAVRFLRYPYPEKTPNEWGNEEQEADEDADEEAEDSDATEDDTEDEDEGGGSLKRQRVESTKPRGKNPAESDDIGELSPKERMELQKNAEIVQRLEDIFSLRCVSLLRISLGIPTQKV